MPISNTDIKALTDGLAAMLLAMREYQQLTVSLLNCEIDEADNYLKARQQLIKDINEKEAAIHDVLYHSSGAQNSDNFGSALKKLSMLSNAADLSETIATANQLLELFRDVNVIDAKLIANIERQREEMVEELKTVTDRRRVAHSPYLDSKAQPIGSAYDKKK